MSSVPPFSVRACPGTMGTMSFSETVTVPADSPSAADQEQHDSPEAPSTPARSDLPADRYLDREQSWVRFNQRVLELAEDEEVPLLERVRFLAIFASNL